MNREIYRSLVVPAHQSPDGESPTLVICTKESNGYAVFLCGHDEGTQLKQYFVSAGRDKAIEAAYRLAMKLRGEPA